MKRHEEIINEIINIIRSTVDVKEEHISEESHESLPVIVDERRGKKLYCSVIRHERVFHLNGEVQLPNGNVDVNITDYVIPGYFLCFEEYDIRKKCYTGRKETYLCGTIHQSAIRAYLLVKKSRAHILHIANVLDEAGYPKTFEFDEHAKSPIKRKARKSGIDGNSVSNRNVVIKGYQVKTA